MRALRVRSVSCEDRSVHGSRRWSTLATLGALAVAASACETFDPPPAVSLAGEHEGVLDSAGAPITLEFSEPVTPATLRVRIAKYVVDGEGRLADEDDDAATSLEESFVHEPGGTDVGGTGVMAPDLRSFVVTPSEPLPVGPTLVVLVERGLADDAGNATKARQAVKFSYAFSCDDASDGGAAGSATSMPTGAYFFLVEVDEPVETQVQLFAWLDVDAATGRVRGEFTNGDRAPDASGCPTPCTDGEVCRRLPAAECVAPSTKAGAIDEFPDWYPNHTPPTGFSFTVAACARDQQGGAIAFATEPVTAVTQSPPVTSQGITMSGVLSREPDGVLRGTGSFAVQEVILGKTPSGPGIGSLRMRLLEGDDVPEDLPRPP